MSDLTTIKEEPQGRVSVFSGCRFSFLFCDHNIELWISNLTGAEQVRVNGVEVSRSRSWRKVSQHVIEVDGQALRITLIVKSLFKGPVYCVLSAMNSGQTQPIAAKQIIVWPASTEESHGTEAGKNSAKQKSWHASLSTAIKVGFAFGVGIFMSRNFDLLSWQFLSGILGLMLLFGAVDYLRTKFFSGVRTAATQSPSSSTKTTSDWLMKVEPIAVSELPHYVTAKLNE